MKFHYYISLFCLSATPLIAIVNVDFTTNPVDISTTGFDGVRFANVGMTGATNLDMIVEVTGSFQAQIRQNDGDLILGNGSGTGSSGSGFGFSRVPVNGGNDVLFLGIQGDPGNSNEAWVSFDIYFVDSLLSDSDAANADNRLIIAEGVNFQAYDIDSASGGDFSDVFGWSDADNSRLSPDSNLERNGFANTVGPVNNYVRLDPNINGGTVWSSANDVATNPTNPNQVDHTVELVYGSYDLETYVWGFTGTTDANRRGMFLSGQNPPLIEIIPEPSATPLLFALAALLLMRRRRK